MPDEDKKDAKEAMDAEAPAESEAADSPVEDTVSPEAIARRVAKLGAEDEGDRIAREEEEKLAERRRLARKGKKKSGLEAAASKKLAKIGAAAPVKRTIASAADADPLIDRAGQFGEWAKKNQRTVQILVAAVVIAVIGIGAYTYVTKKRETDASVELGKAVADERGRIGDPDKDDEEQHHDTRPVFKTVDDRRAAALGEYRTIETKFPGTGAAILARLAEGSILLDKGDADGAATAFTDVKGSALAQADAEVRGRALEGLGFAYEMKAQGKPADQAAPLLDDASKTFRELENMDVLGFKELGMYHQARVAETKGDKAKAIELLKNLHERVTKPGENHPFPYLETVADDRLRALDPAAIPPKQAGRLGGPGGNQLTEEQIKRLMEQLQKQAKDQGGEQGGGAPPPPPVKAPK